MKIIGFPNYSIFLNGTVQNDKTGRIMKQYIKNEYSCLGLYNDNKEQVILQIHRLVATHFIPNPKNKEFVRHKDKNRLNNWVSNLEWCDRIEICSNNKKQINNTSGIKNIRYRKELKLWIYQKTYLKYKFNKGNENKQIILWVKFYDYIMIKNKLI